ncbi:MAG: hypothetical protein ACREFQ_16295, partial [Stellaceae bacterium]
APDSNWRQLLALFWFVRTSRNLAALAYAAQAATVVGLAAVVWRVWRSQIGYALKAATLSAAALLASPHVFTYDLAAIVIPAAFLADDQLRHGLLPGDRTVWILLFGVPLALLVTLGDNAHGPTFSSTPIGVLTSIALFAAVLRRAASPRVKPLTAEVEAR